MCNGQDAGHTKSTLKALICPQIRVLWFGRFLLNESLNAFVLSLVAPLGFSLGLAFPFYNFTLLDSQGIFRTNLWLDLTMSGPGGWPGWAHFIKGVVSVHLFLKWGFRGLKLGLGSNKLGQGFRMGPLLVLQYFYFLDFVAKRVIFSVNKQTNKIHLMGKWKTCWAVGPVLITIAKFPDLPVFS